MAWIKSHSSRLRNGVGILLVLSGFFFGYWWFYKLAPVCHTLDRQWQFAHSQREYWAEVEMAIRRGLWVHDDGFTVGWYGDKSWAEWIMARVRPGDKMGCMGAKLCHSATAMEYITNQNMGEEAGPWLTWWENNKSKAQEEWIADGFRQNGVEVAVPPTPEQISVLLAILGAPKPKDGASTVPTPLIYNAFRCLRDSGFEPVDYLLTHRTPSPEIERGLLRYEKDLRRWPSAGNVGVLPFGKKSFENTGQPKAQILDPRVHVLAYSLIFVPILLGTALLAGSFWKNHKSC